MGFGHGDADTVLFDSRAECGRFAEYFQYDQQCV